MQEIEMTHAITHDISTTSSEAGGWIARIRKSLTDYRLYRKTLEELESLSDRELNDLGLSRLVLRDIARQAVYDV
jgi:uncharacterized protein YjiS (DUF1127 family)